MSSERLPFGLTHKQISAIALLLLGLTDQQTADEVGVHRVTVTRWRLYNLRFQAELNRRSSEMFNVFRRRLMLLALKSASVLEQSIDRGEAASSMGVFRTIVSRTDLLNPTGPDDLDSLVQAAVGSYQAKTVAEEAISEQQAREALAALEKQQEEESYNQSGDVDVDGALGGGVDAPDN